MASNIGWNYAISEVQTRRCSWVEEFSNANNKLVVLITTLQFFMVRTRRSFIIGHNHRQTTSTLYPIILLLLNLASTTLVPVNSGSISGCQVQLNRCDSSMWRGFFGSRMDFGWLRVLNRRIGWSIRDFGCVLGCDFKLSCVMGYGRWGCIIRLLYRGQRRRRKIPRPWYLWNPDCQ